MLRRLAWILGGLLVVAIALAAIGVRLIDTPAVRAQIQARLAAALGGQVEWEALELRILPAPHGALRRVRIEVPGALSARAEEVQAGLRLWPLLRGRVEIGAFSISRPEVRVLAAGGGGGGGARPEPLAAYRAAIEPLAAALRRFAPDTQFVIRSATVDLPALPLELRELNADLRTTAQGLRVGLDAGSRHWKRVKVDARIAYADLAAQADVEVDALAIPEPGVPPATLRAKLRTDARSSIEAEVDGALGSLAPDVKAKLRLPAGQPPALTARLTDIDLAAAAAIARRRLAGLEAIESIGGRLSAEVSASLGEPWHAQGELTASGASLKLAALPWRLSPQAAQIHVTRTELRVQGARGSIGESSFSNAAARLELGAPLRLAEASGRASLRLEQWFPWLRERVAALQEITALSGAAEVDLRKLALRFDRPAEADYDATVQLSGASVALKALPWKVSPQAAQIHATRSAVQVRGLRGSIGESSISNAEATLELGKTPRLAAASARASLRLEQWFPWLRERVPQLGEIETLSGEADVSLARLALRFDRPAEADYEALVAVRKTSVALKALPAPVAVSGGSARVDPARVQFDKVAASMLDAAALVSGSVTLKDGSLQLAVADGVLGEKGVQWGMGRAGLPARLEPKAPLRVSAQRIAWGPGSALDTEARIGFDGGPQLGLALGWRPEHLEVRSLTLKDAHSDAALGLLAAAGGELQASFSGSLDGRSIAAMLRRPPPAQAGVARGDLRLTIDREQPARTRGEGELKVEALDLTWLAGRRTIIERADLSALPDGLRIAEAALDLEEQKFSLSGSVRRTGQGPVVDARLESPGVVVEKLLPAAPAGAEKPAAAAPQAGPSKLWPLPVTGRIEVNAGFVQFPKHRIEPFEGRLSFEREQARLEVQKASMCGLSFPLTFDATPETFAAQAQITMRSEPLDTAVHCLTGGALEISGAAELRAELRTQGKGREDLVRNLAGTAQAEVRNGRVKKFALIGNILSLRSIASPRQMEAEGFPYRSMSAKGQFRGGEFLLEEGFFDSDAARLAASGRVDLLGADSRLDVLLGLLTTVDRVAGAIPIIGDVFGGSMTALPISVTGDIRDPRVVPLGPRAVTDRLLGIFERTLKLPGKLIVHPSAGETASPPAR